MTLFIGEAHDLVLDRRTVTRAGGVDLARVHRRAMKVGADEVVRDGAGVGQMTEHLREQELIGEDGKRPRRGVAIRFFHLREIYGASVDTGRRSCFEPAEFQAEVAERIRQRLRCWLAEAAANGLLFAGMHQRSEERAGSDDDGARIEARPVAEDHAANGVALHDQRPHGTFNDGQVRFSAEDLLNGTRVQLAIALGAWTLHGGTFGAIQHFELDPGAIRRLGHESAESVDLFDQVPFCQTADCRIARHPADRLAQHRHQRYARAAASTDAGSLSAGVPSANDDHIKHVSRGTVARKRSLPDAEFGEDLGKDVVLCDRAGKKAE
jgi:hypothetical protein